MLLLYMQFVTIVCCFSHQCPGKNLFGFVCFSFNLVLFTLIQIAFGLRQFFSTVLFYSLFNFVGVLN